MSNTSSSKFSEDFARLMSDAAGVAQGAGREARGFFQHQAENILGEMNVVSQEEFDIVKEMATQARLENETLRADITALQKEVKALKTAQKKST